MARRRPLCAQNRRQHEPAIPGQRQEKDKSPVGRRSNYPHPKRSGYRVGDDEHCRHPQQHRQAGKRPRQCEPGNDKDQQGVAESQVAAAEDQSQVPPPLGGPPPRPNVDVRRPRNYPCQSQGDNRQAIERAGIDQCRASRSRRQWPCRRYATDTHSISAGNRNRPDPLSPVRKCPPDRDLSSEARLDASRDASPRRCSTAATLPRRTLCRSSSTAGYCRRIAATAHRWPGRRPPRRPRTQRPSAGPSRN